MKNSIVWIALIVLSTISPNYFSQFLDGFDIIKLIPTSTVKDQGYSSTCWSYGTISFLESETIRKGNGEFNLSEMFIVRNIYPEKAKNYFRTQGNTYFTAGGQTQDVLRVMKKYGLLPEYAYKELFKEFHLNTSFLDTALLNYVKYLRKEEDDIISLDWSMKFDSILNYYLGPTPKEFMFRNIVYTPRSFCDDVLGLKESDYIQITSYSHHPYQKYFCLESKYNWSFEPYYNIELSQFMNILKNSILNGYSVVFNGDVTENDFDFNNGIAKISEKYLDEVAKRQEMFETGSSTVDHVMHIIGLAKDKDGNYYYITKNSWGKENSCSGYIYLSEDFIKYKAVSLLINKDVLQL